MVLKDKKFEQIVKIFYEHPNKKLPIRFVAKITKIPKSTVQYYLSKLKKEGIITKDNSSTDESLLFKTKKINYYMEKIVSTGLLDYLIKELNPSCIIFFGSCRKGESEKESDIDLFIETYIKKSINAEKYEKLLKHRIQLFIETNINKLPVHLFNNVINGIKLYGSFKIK